MRSSRVFLLLCCVVARLAAAPWRQLESDLPPAPGLRRGALPNGLTYLVLPNPEPKDHVSLRLVVAAGSNHEQDDELGLAHFVEHMAFRGSKAFPGGTTAALQRLGMALGPDSTAFTNQDYTIYNLELPDTKPATLREGLRVFHEYATAVTFEAAAIERERGVVLSEMALRDKPEARAYEYRRARLWPGAREVQRPVIGEAAAIRRFTREQCVAFYNAWYRPERIGVIAVGPVNGAEFERLLRETFASDAPRAPARPEPPANDASAAGRSDVVVFSDPGIIGVSFALDHPVHRPLEASTRARRARDLRESLALAMVQARLQRRANEADAAFLSPIAQISPGVADWPIASIGVSGKIDDWKLALVALEQEHRRAFQAGFVPHELDAVRAAVTTGLDQAVRSAATRPSPYLAEMLVGTLLYSAPSATPEQIRAEIAPELERVTVEECRQAFRNLWSGAAPHVIAIANPSFAITRAQIAAVLNDSRATAVVAPEAKAVQTFAYTEFGPAGTLVRDERVADLDVRLARFANGAALNFKSTTFAANQVQMRIRVGDGQQTQTARLAGIDTLAEQAFIAGGLGRHTAIELSEIMQRHSLQMYFNVQSDTLEFGAFCAPADVPLALRIVAAFLTDPAYRPDSIRHARAGYGSIYADLGASPGGPIHAFALPAIFGGDARLGIAPLEQLYARDLGELTAWLEPQLTHGAIELSIVGDISWDAARDAVAATLGALPDRAALVDAPPLIPITPTPVSAQTQQIVMPVDARLGQQAIAWYWTAPQIADIHEERRCLFLAQVLAERLRVRLRDEVGATYAPSAMFGQINGFPNANFFTLYAEFAPAAMRPAAAIIQRELTDLARNGVSADEFERVKAPFLRSRADDLRRNEYWGGTVLADAQQRPKRITAARDRTADTAAITRAEINALAKRFLDPAKAFKFATFSPRSGVPAGKNPP